MRRVLTGLVLPGLLQYRRGHRLLGGAALAATGVVWLTLAVGFILVVGSPETLLALQPIWCAALVGGLLYGLLWLVLVGQVGLITCRESARASVRGIIAFVTIAAMALVVSGAGYAGFVGYTARRALATLVESGPPVEPVDGRYNVLLLGTDAGPDRPGRRTDSISVVSVDAHTGHIVIIGLPRGLQQIPLPAESPLRADWASGVYDCGRDCQLGFLYQRTERFGAASYPNAGFNRSSPGVEAVRDAAEGALGISLPFYLRVDMHVFEQLIDALGGVEVTVAERLPIGGDADGVGVIGWIEPGTQRMDGFTALWYARSRQSTSDYDRMERQRELQSALLTQQNPIGVAIGLSEITDATTDAVATDLPDGMLARLLGLAMKGRTAAPTTLELVPPYIDLVHPDYARMRADVVAALARD